MGIRPVEYRPYLTRAFLDQLTTPSDRKLRLFMIECHRRVADVCNQPELHPVLQVFSGHVDGNLSHAELFAAFEKANPRHKSALLTLARAGGLVVTREELTNTAEWVVSVLATQRYPDVKYGDPDYWPKHCDVMHEEDEVRLSWLIDIFGNLFRPVAFDPRWRSESAVALARTAYDTRNFTLLPILADALEEAGCDHPEVLSHCRDPRQVHVRGCWVVDLVLDKS
jgi:hypothetical protein